VTNDLLPARGRPGLPLTFEVVRELSVADLTRALTAPLVGVPPIQRLRTVHHRQARLIAEGRKLAEVAAIVGSTPERLSQLLRDPMFSELVVYYQDQLMVTELEDARRINAKLVSAAEAALDEINERVGDEEKVKGIHIGELRKVAELGLDRTVAPPKTAAPPVTVPANITLNFGTSLKPVAVIEGEAKLVSDDKEKKDG